MKRRNFVTQDRLKELFRYEPDTGLFIRLVRTAQRVQVGDVSRANSNGYVSIWIDGYGYRAHRLAWLYVYGEWPKFDIDHINGIRDDNRLLNLRDVTQQVNVQNVKKARSDSKSGHLGVSWNKASRKWLSRIAVNKRIIHLGYFTDIEMAIIARKSAETIYHPSKPKMGAI